MTRSFHRLLAFSVLLCACSSDTGQNGDTMVSDTSDTTVITDSGDTVDPDSGDDDTTETNLTDTGVETDTTTPECASACDCAQGQACDAGVCTLGAEPVYCCANDGCPAGDLCVEVAGADALCGAQRSAIVGLVFNEVLIDGRVSGDPNGDGDPSDAVGDEFVELVNTSSGAIDLAGFTLEETTFEGLPRHTFVSGTVIGPGDAVVVFGGGSAPDDIAGTHFEVANAQDPGISFGLSLDDDGDALALRDETGALITVFSWGPASSQRPSLSDRSYTRSPDLSGDFVPHDDAQPNTLYSPGTLTDGTRF